MNLFAGIIFSDSYSAETNLLAKNRTLASIPFCGRFRTVDFILSSLVNAGVDNVAVVTKRNYASLEDHLGGGRYWDLDHRSSGLRILSPFYRTENNNEVFLARGKLDALRSVSPYIKGLKEEYIVLTNSNIIASVDFERAFDFHIESGADITAVYSGRRGSPGDLELHLEDERVREMTYIVEEEQSVKDTSLGIYIMSRKLLLDIIRRADEHDHYSFEKYALIKNTSSLKILGFEHREFSGIVNTVKDYYDISMKMLDSDVRSQVFKSDSPVMTRVMDTVPVLYKYNASVENSLIADGCRIDGTVKNSIIFRNVTIETGAVVENSIIMQNSVVGKNCGLGYVILDKNIHVSENKYLCGAPEYPYVFVKNTRI